jgi:glycosyltransferase involved in cell wall biosynthesis
LVSIAYLWKGQSKSIRQILQFASCVIVQSASEYAALQKRYAINGSYVIIKNGINQALFTPGVSPVVRDQNLILCVARIEGIKNQINLIKHLIIHGITFY